MNPMLSRLVICSRWIMAIAAGSVYLCSSANASPYSVLLISTLSRPITWKSGTVHSVRRRGSMSAGGMEPSISTIPRRMYHVDTSGEEITWSCVEITGFGTDVVPDVNRISAWSSSPMVCTGGGAAPRYEWYSCITSSQSCTRQSTRSPSTHGRSPCARSGCASRSPITIAYRSAGCAGSLSGYAVPRNSALRCGVSCVQAPSSRNAMRAPTMLMHAATISARWNAFTAAGTAPSRCSAQNTVTNSIVLRDTIATRSPRWMLYRTCRAYASTIEARRTSRKLARRVSLIT